MFVPTGYVWEVLVIFQKELKTKSKILLLKYEKRLVGTNSPQFFQKTRIPW